MKRFMLLLIVALCALGTVFAQGKTELVTEAPPTALTIWSAAAEDEAEALRAAFNAHYPDIKVSVIRAGSGELITRLNAEQPKPQGDILLAIAKETFDAHYDLFRGYKSVNHNAIIPQER